MDNPTVVLLEKNAYGPTRTFIDGNLVQMGIECTYVQGTDIDDFEKAIKPNTSMIYLESPTSAVMELQDLEAVATLLEQHPKVKRVNYPVLKSYKQYELAQKQLTGSSGLLSFELDADLEQTKAFVNNLKLFHKGVSWGGFESLACLPMYKVSEEEAHLRDANRNLIRIYCGLENTEDLLCDIKNALSEIQ